MIGKCGRLLWTSDIILPKVFPLATRHNDLASKSVLFAYS
jgi:hypothetical protein